MAGFHRNTRTKVRSSGMKGFDKIAKNVFRGLAKSINKAGDSLVKKYSNKKK